MRRNLRSLVFLMLVPAMAWASTTQTFAPGSLIIPLQSSFQTPCGAEAAYGLVYRLLQGNQPGGYFDPATNPNGPLTIWWTIRSNKSAPNLCVPTNLNTVAPDGSGTDLTGGGSHTSTLDGAPLSAWNTGCDFSITNTLNPTDSPVHPVDYSVDPWIPGQTGTLGRFDEQNGTPMRTPGVIGKDPTRAPSGSQPHNIDLNMGPAPQFLNLQVQQTGITYIDLFGTILGGTANGYLDIAASASGGSGTGYVDVIAFNPGGGYLPLWGYIQCGGPMDCNPGMALPAGVTAQCLNGDGQPGHAPPGQKYCSYQSTTTCAGVANCTSSYPNMGAPNACSGVCVNSPSTQCTGVAQCPNNGTCSAVCTEDNSWACTIGMNATCNLGHCMGQDCHNYHNIACNGNGDCQLQCDFTAPGAVCNNDNSKTCNTQGNGQCNFGACNQNCNGHGNNCCAGDSNICCGPHCNGWGGAVGTCSDNCVGTACFLSPGGQQTAQSQSCQQNSDCNATCGHQTGNGCEYDYYNTGSCNADPDCMGTCGVCSATVGGSNVPCTTNANCQAACGSSTCQWTTPTVTISSAGTPGAPAAGAFWNGGGWPSFTATSSVQISGLQISLTDGVNSGNQQHTNSSGVATGLNLNNPMLMDPTVGSTATALANSNVNGNGGYYITEPNTNGGMGTYDVKFTAQNPAQNTSFAIPSTTATLSGTSAHHSQNIVIQDSNGNQLASTNTPSSGNGSPPSVTWSTSPITLNIPAASLVSATNPGMGSPNFAAGMGQFGTGNGDNAAVTYFTVSGSGVTVNITSPAVAPSGAAGPTSVTMSGTTTPLTDGVTINFVDGNGAALNCGTVTTGPPLAHGTWTATCNYSATNLSSGYVGYTSGNKTSYTIAASSAVTLTSPAPGTNYTGAIYPVFEGTTNPPVSAGTVYIYMVNPTGSCPVGDTCDGPPAYDILVTTATTASDGSFTSAPWTGFTTPAPVPSVGYTGYTSGAGTYITRTPAITFTTPVTNVGTDPSTISLQGSSGTVSVAVTTVAGTSMQFLDGHNVVMAVATGAPATASLAGTWSGTLTYTAANLTSGLQWNTATSAPSFQFNASTNTNETYVPVAVSTAAGATSPTDYEYAYISNVPPSVTSSIETNIALGTTLTLKGGLEPCGTAHTCQTSPGVTVKLYNNANTQVGTAITTDNQGHWSMTYSPVTADVNNPDVINGNEALAYGTVGLETIAGLQYIGYGTPEAIPGYPAETLVSPGFKTIGYMGSEFVIDGSQAQMVIEFLEHELPSWNQYYSKPDYLTIGCNGANCGPNVTSNPFSVLDEFTAGNASYTSLISHAQGMVNGSIPTAYFDSCTGPLLLENAVRPPGNADVHAYTDHYVTMHQSMVSIPNVTVARVINNVPPKVALIDAESDGDNTGTNSVSGLKILDSYLGNAGLFYVNTVGHHDSGGCPKNSIANNCTRNGSVGGGNHYPGFIYDQFDADADLMATTAYPHGILSSINPITHQNNYQILWTPHWEANNSTDPTYNGSYVAPTGSPPLGVDALENISYFLKQQGNGLMGECASIGSYEGGPNGWGLDDTPNQTTNGYTYNTNFMYTGPLTINGLSVDDGNWEGNSCGDPDFPNNISHACTAAVNNVAPTTCSTKGSAHSSTNQECINWTNTSSEFAQIGDYHFVQTSGAIDDYEPSGGYFAQPNVPAGTDDVSHIATTQSTNAPDNGWRIMDTYFNNNDVKEGLVVYVAGHDYQISTVASRIILDTLLNISQVPQYADRAMAAPTIWTQPAEPPTIPTAFPLVFIPVFDAVSGLPSFSYTWGTASTWSFPEIPGDLIETPLCSDTTCAVEDVTPNAFQSFRSVHDIATAQGEFNSVYAGNTVNYRNIFTYFGGQPTYNASFPNNALDVGWQPSPVTAQELIRGATAANTAPPWSEPPGCVDVLGYGVYDDGKHGAGLGLVVNGGDGVCDLEEAVTPTSGPSGVSPTAPLSGTPINNAAIVTLMASGASVGGPFDYATGLLEQVQGYCFAVGGSGHAAIPGSSGDCQGAGQSDNPVMGGLIHSVPAVVGPSPYDTNNPNPRPTVAYAAGADGQLHAFYVSGGNNYAGPSSTLHYPNASPSYRFSTEFGGTFSPPGAMTELWSFMPASQLPLLASNQQMIDSAPVVQDVFADFTTNQTCIAGANPSAPFHCSSQSGPAGIKEWHTILVATASGPYAYQGSEVFALDISNPLEPVLLWDLVGNFPTTFGFAPVALANGQMNGTSTVTPLSASEWGTNVIGAGAAGTTPLFIQTSPTGTPAAGVYNTGVYNYANLGTTFGLSIAQLPQGSEQGAGIFLSSNLMNDAVDSASSPGASTALSIGTNGAQVTAIDPATGQLLWVWQKAYNLSVAICTAANCPSDEVPPPVTMVPDIGPIPGSGPQVAKTLYFADLEGYMWELNPAAPSDVLSSAVTMTSINPWNGKGENSSGAIFYTQGGANGTAGPAAGVLDPLTTSVAVARLPTLTPAAALYPWRSNVISLMATGGVSEAAPLSSGNYNGLIHVADLSAPRATGAVSGLAASDEATALAPVLPGNPFPLSVTGQRFFGNITVSGQTAYFSTASQVITSPNNISTSSTGGTFALDLGNSAATLSSNITSALTGGVSQGNYGGVATYTDSTGVTHVLGSQAGQLFHATTAAGSASTDAAPSSQEKVSQQQLLYQVLGWIRRVL